MSNLPASHASQSNIARPVSASATTTSAMRSPQHGNVLFPTAPQLSSGASIVACCMNRHSTLRTVLPAWRAVENVSEIILVDWSSEPPLQPLVSQLVADDTRVRVIRVDSEPAWILSRAYNLGVSVARHDTIIRTDCDYSLSPTFLSSHPLTSRQFYAGNYKHARNENEIHLNGAVLIRRADFLSVGGYDERIQTYGWDDEDLYTRLEKSGMQKLNLSYDMVSHVPHGDGARAQRDVKFVQVEIDLNSLLLEKLSKWNASDASSSTSQWAVASHSKGLTRVSAAVKPRALKELVDANVFASAWDLALSRRLSNDYSIPWDIMETMTSEMKRRLLTRLNRPMGDERSGNDGPARVLFVHVMHGLGNRLRALGSAMSFAQQTKRELVLIWETDAHISARFDELFKDEMVVIDKFKPKWPFRNADSYDKAWLNFEFFNYMEMEGNGALKGQRIVNKPDKHMYVKSAYVLEADARLTDWEKDNAMLRSLTAVDEVNEAVRRREAQGLKKMVGVHIRDRTLDRDIKNVNFGSEYGESASKEMEYWRRRSSYKNFLSEMKRILSKDSEAKFYVATDTVDVVKKLRSEFQGRILSTDRDCDGRDGRCVRFALVDILCLARTKVLMGSNWSSFTEAASRFGGLAPRLAGKDFAAQEDSAVSGNNHASAVRGNNNNGNVTV